MKSPLTNIAKRSTMTNLLDSLNDWINELLFLSLYFSSPLFPAVRTPCGTRKGCDCSVGFRNKLQLKLNLMHFNTPKYVAQIEKETYRSGRSVRSSRNTRRIPKMRVLDAAVMETTMSMSEMSTRKPSITFQPLRKYELSSSKRPPASTFENTPRSTALAGRLLLMLEYLLHRGCVFVWFYVFVNHISVCQD